MRSCWLLAVLLFGPTSLATAVGDECDAARVDRGRREFKASYDAGRVREAFDALSAVQRSCRDYLARPADDARLHRVWLVSDLALAAYKLGDLPGCRELVEPLEDEFVQTRDVPGLKQAWRSVAFNYNRCDCYDVKRPLCREGSWLKLGYGEIEVQVHPSLPNWKVRLVFDVEDTPQQRPDGSSYFSSDATMSAVEVRNPEGRLLQGIDIEGGATDYLGSGQGGPPLQLEDQNFDGYLDIAAGNSCGNGACCVEQVFLFDPARKRFAYHEELSNVCFAEIDAEKKQIWSTWRESACVHGRTVYAWEKAELVIAERETESGCHCDADEMQTGRCQAEVVVERRIAGALKIVSTSKPKRDP